MIKFILIFISLNFLTLIINKKLINLLIRFKLFIILNLIIINLLNIYWVKINYLFGIDYIRLNLIILRIWIIFLSIFSNNNFVISIYNINFLNLNILLTNILILCFCSINIIIFYIIFESRLIPVIFIIMGWGYQIDRIQARIYILFYTLFASLPLLVLLIFIYKKYYTLIFNILILKNNYNFINLLLYIILILAFFVKIPLYIVHLWLPKAHVEAPIRGSIILAGIILKLGRYGLYRFINIFKLIFISYNYFLIIFALIGGLMRRLICLNQNDIKIIVAYSSVVHIRILIRGMITILFIGIIGSLFIIISHGLCSCGIFFLLNLNYERVKSRTLYINKGLINILPSLTLWWFLIFSSNFSAPPSLNLFREILLFNSLIQWRVYLIILIILISFFRTCYSIYIYAFRQYGKINYLFISFNFIFCREYLIRILLWIPLNFLFLNLNLIF